MSEDETTIEETSNVEPEPLLAPILADIIMEHVHAHFNAIMVDEQTVTSSMSAFR